MSGKAKPFTKADRVAMLAAGEPHRRRFNGKSCCWCRYCGGRWTWDDRAQSTDPLNHGRACIWRIAKLYAEDVSGG